MNPLTWVLVTYCVGVLATNGVESAPRCEVAAIPTDLTPLQCQVGSAAQQIVTQWADGKAGIRVIHYTCDVEKRA